MGRNTREELEKQICDCLVTCTSQRIIEWKCQADRYFEASFSEFTIDVCAFDSKRTWVTFCSGLQEKVIIIGPTIETVDGTEKMVAHPLLQKIRDTCLVPPAGPSPLLEDLIKELLRRP